MRICIDEKTDVFAKLKEFPYDPHEYWVVAGAAMVLLAVILLITKKRMTTAE